ncbi:hypothetical protein FRC19_008945 [Serendipita sp. 401]|nr:hypothetical protein FRC19_008945 [Serendipita sp. 401]
MATDAEREKIQEILSRDEYRMNIHSNYWLRFLNHSNRTVTLSTFAFVVGTRMLGSAYFGAGALLCVGLAKALKLVLRESRPVGTTYKVTYGMPSTHSATISYYATFITLSCAYLPIHPLFFHTWFDGPINSTIVRCTSGKAGGSGAKAEAKPSVLPTNRDQLVIDDAPEVYSEDENEEGRVIDLEEVKMLDFMAPDALKKERRKERKSKGKQVAKKEVIEIDISEPKESGDQDPIVKEEMKNESQALDLSESEEEIELEDLQQYFQVSEDDASLNPNELYFFQFPDSFPVFSHPSELAASIDEENEVERTDESTALKAESSGKKVSFAEDVKAGSSGPATPRQREPPRTEGIIGQLEIHQSGAVRIRMPNNIVFDVSAATRPAFLQQAVLVDIDAMKMSVLGSVTRRFVASPDIDALTASLGEEKPEVMDVDLP